MGSQEVQGLKNKKNAYMGKSTNTDKTILGG